MPYKCFESSKFDLNFEHLLLLFLFGIEIGKVTTISFSGVIVSLSFHFCSFLRLRNHLSPCVSCFLSIIKKVKT